MEVFTWALFVVELDHHKRSRHLVQCLMCRHCCMEKLQAAA